MAARQPVMEHQTNNRHDQEWGYSNRVIDLLNDEVKKGI